MRRAFVAAVACAIAIACGRDSVEDAGAGDRQEVWELQTPATFVGTVHCEGCQELAVTVTLFEDGTFRERRAEGAPVGGRVAHELGRWSPMAAGTLVLRGARRVREASVTSDVLEVVSQEGDAEGPVPPYALHRAGDVDPVEDVMRLLGMMATFPDGVRFTECGTGVAYRIAPGEAGSALERAYLDAISDAADAVLVEVTGRLLRSSGGEASASGELVVERRERTLAGIGCESRPQDRPIESVDWVLVELPGGAEVPEDSGAMLRLEPEGRVASGFTGCSRFDGTYELVGPKLTVAPGASARRACPTPAAARVERDFLEALRVTGSVGVVGDRMDLIGERGVVARLRARD